MGIDPKLPETIARLRELLAKATPEPWEHRFELKKSGEQTIIHAPNGEDTLLGKLVIGTVEYDGLNIALKQEDGDLIAELRNNAVALLDAAERCARLEIAIRVAEQEHFIACSSDCDGEQLCAGCRLRRALSEPPGKKERV